MVKIELKDVHFSYDGGPEVLSGISTEIPEGTSLAIMGANGAGKTTLIKMLNGLLLPTRGSVLINGVDTRKLRVSEIARKVGVVFQNPEKQFFSETVENELSFGLNNMGFSDQEIKERVLKVAERFGLTHYLNRNPFDLSGGEKRRLSIASVLAWEPEVIVIDEPTIGLDYTYRRYLISLLRNLASENKSVIIVTHDIDFAIHVSEEAILMSRGRIIWNGPIVSLLRSPEVLLPANLVETFLVSFLTNVLSQGDVQYRDILKHLWMIMEEVT